MAISAPPRHSEGAERRKNPSGVRGTKGLARWSLPWAIWEILRCAQNDRKRRDQNDIRRRVRNDKLAIAEHLFSLVNNLF